MRGEADVGNFRQQSVLLSGSFIIVASELHLHSLSASIAVLVRMIEVRAGHREVLKK